MILRKKIGKAIVAGVCAFSFMLTGCGTAGGGETPTGGSVTTAEITAKKLKIGFNNYSQGIYSLDILETGFRKTCESLGVEPYVVNDEGKEDRSVANIDSMISNGVDGILFFGMTDRIVETVADKCRAADIPFALFDRMPGEAILKTIQESPDFAGAAATVDTTTGKKTAEYAIDRQKKQAIVITGLETDTTHKARTEGFEQTFTSAGGKLLDLSHGAVDRSQITDRVNSSLTEYPEADVIYATNGEIGAAVIEVLAKHPNVHADLYVTDLDPGVLKELKDGKLAAATGAHWINADVAAALLVNKLRGNLIKDEDGKPAVLEVPVIAVPSNYVDLYYKCFIQNHPFSADELKSWVGTGVTEQTFKDILSGYTIQSRLEQKVKDGLITQDELVF